MSPDNYVGGYRRDFCYGSWNWLRPGNWLTDGEGYLIDGVGDWGVHKTGAMIEVFPVEGLNAYVMVPFNADGDKVLAEDTYKQVQVGANYAIDGVGTLSAVYIGKYTPKKDDGVKWVNADGDDVANPSITQVANSEVTLVADPAADAKDYSTVEAAFELTSVENLYVGVGFKMNIFDAGKTGKDENKMAVKLGASYQLNEDAKVYANGGFYTYNKGKDDGGVDPRFEFGVGIDYNLGDGLSANADVRYLSKKNDADKSDKLSFLAGVTKGISSNGLVGLGFQGITNNDGEKNDKLTWSIPVRVEMWF
jgi:hypothetical protein